MEPNEEMKKTTYKLLYTLQSMKPETRAEWKKQAIEQQPRAAAFCDEALKAV